MNQITTQLDRIIARLKQNEKLAKVKFIREHGNHGAEINLTSFLAVVAVTDTVLSKKYVGDYLSASVKGEQFLAKVQIFVYAPADENGNGLSEITCEIMQGLKKADTEKIISELLVSVYGVKQYMSDSVSCAHTKDEYTVTIEMNVPSREGFLKESRMDSIELKTADGSETYRNCTVKSAWCRHKSADFSILKMVLGCEKREVT